MSERRIIGYLHDLGCKPWRGCACNPDVVYERGEYNDSAREVATDIDSRRPGLSDFPQRSGLLRGDEGEAS